MPVKRQKIRLCSSVQPSTNLPRMNPEMKPMKVNEMNPKPKAITNLKSSYSLSLSNYFLLLNPSIWSTIALYLRRSTLVRISSRPFLLTSRRFNIMSYGSGLSLLSYSRVFVDRSWNLIKSCRDLIAIFWLFLGCFIVIDESESFWRFWLQKCDWIKTGYSSWHKSFSVTLTKRSKSSLYFKRLSYYLWDSNSLPELSSTSLFILSDGSSLILTSSLSLCRSSWLYICLRTLLWRYLTWRRHSAKF